MQLNLILLRFILIFILINLKYSFSQVIMGIQDFETPAATPTLTYTGGTLTPITITTYYPSDPDYVSSSHGVFETKGTSKMIFNTIDASSYTDINISFRLAAFGSSNSIGLDSGDDVIVYISTDGGTTWIPELEIEGNNNARWSFLSGSGVATTAYNGTGVTTVFSPAGGGNRTTDGYTYISVTDLPNSANLRVKVEMTNDSYEKEYWVMDDFVMEGIPISSSLPVDLLFFNAVEVDNKSVQTSWATVTEINNDYFTVERSKDGVNFEFVGNVQGAGNYNGQLNYDLLDENPYGGVSYYRLKQTDFDDQYEYSNIVAVNLKDDEQTVFNIYPIPFENTVNVVVNNEEEVEATLYDISGKLILREIFTSSRELDLSNMAAGSYFIQLKTNTTSEVIQLIKE